jgi:thiamine transport system permease protein
VWAALKITLLQAVLSGIISTVFGFLFAIALNSEQGRRRNFLTVALILPTFLPTIFSLSLCLRLINPFPFGLWGIIIVNTFINAGFVGFIWSKEIIEGLGDAEKLSRIEGASRRLFWKTCFPVIFRQSIRYFQLVFIFCIPSFTIPLVVGGSQGTTLEVLIYEKIRNQGNFVEAFQISFFQSVLLALASLYMVRSKLNLNSFWQEQVVEEHPYLGSRILSRLFTILAWVLALIFAWEFILGLRELNRIPGLGAEAFELIGKSLLVVGLTLLFASGLFLIQVMVDPNSKLQKVMSGFFALSPALIGFLVLLLGGEGSIWGLAFALTLLFYTGAWRIFGYSKYLALSPQIEMAKILGSSKALILWEISLPQMLRPWADTMGVLSIWCLGEFAVAKLVMAQESTLGILAGNLMSSYRLRSSFVITALILFVGAILWLSLRRLAHVLNSKLI